MQYFNTDFLVRVEVNDFCKSNRYYYLPFKKKTFWSKEQKEGIYDAHDVGNRYIGSVEQFLVENKKYSFNDDSKIIYGETLLTKEFKEEIKRSLGAKVHLTEIEGRYIW